MEAKSNEDRGDWLEKRGEPNVAEGNGLVYPRSGRAADVQQSLLRQLEQAGGRLVLGCQARRLLVPDGRVTGVESDLGTVAAGAVVIAGGGKGYPELGGSAAGYELAEQAGHAIV